MCRGDIEFAESVLDVTSGMTFWRDLTDDERTFGDIPRMASDFDRAEQEAVEAAAPIVREMVAQLVAEALALVQDGDLAGVAKLTASYEGPLAKAIRSSASASVERGKAQVHDQYRRQRGTRFASLPPRRRPKLTRNYLTAKAEVQAREVSEAITAAARTQAIAQVARGAIDEEGLLAAVKAAAESSLLRSAVQVAREGIAVGRYIAIEDTVDDIDKMIYTAILDNNLCDECASKDNEEVDDIDAAPNPECVGEQYGNACRCAVIVIYKR